MAFDAYEDISTGRPRLEPARSSVLKIVVLFGVVAIGVALIASN